MLENHPMYAQPTPPDLEEAEPARRPVMPDQLADPIGWLIYRVMFLTEEQMQDGPVSMVTKAAAVAQLYQAKALTEIAEQLSAIDENLTGLRALARDLDLKFGTLR